MPEQALRERLQRGGRQQVDAAQGTQRADQAPGAAQARQQLAAHPINLEGAPHQETLAL